MLVSLALRLLDHTEFSSPADICFTYESIDRLYGKKGSKSTTQSHNLLQEVRKALASVPSIKKGLKGESEADTSQVLPHFILNEYVWCQDGGWGFWPGKIISINEDVIIIQFYNQERCYTPVNQSKKKLRPFLHDFDDLTKTSTCRLDGFEDAVNKSLRDLCTSRTLPEEIEREVKASANSDRWTHRMKNISIAIQKELRALHSYPMFQNPKAIVQKRLKLEERRKQQEEKAILAAEKKLVRAALQEERDRIRQEKEEARAKREQELAELEKEQKAQRKAEAAAARRRAVSLIEMLHNLESSAALPEALATTQRVRRSMVHQPTSSSSSVNTSTGKSGSNGSSADMSSASVMTNVGSRDRNRSTGTIGDSRRRGSAGTGNTEPRAMGILRSFRALLHPKVPRRAVGMVDGRSVDESSVHSGGGTDSGMNSNGKRNRTSYSGDSSDDESTKASTAVGQVAGTSQAVSISQLYVNLYDYLSVGGHVPSEAIVFSLEHDLPIQVLRMLLSRYAPVEVFRSPRSGKTLLHIAAEHNKYKALPYINAHWVARQEALTMLMRRVDLVNLKDYQKRTPVHIACEKGHFRSLTALHKLKCSLNERDSGGYTPLMWCASMGSSKCAVYLIRNGVGIDAEDKKGYSTLFYAIAGGSVELGKLLLVNGCWMSGAAMREFVSDMSLGREPHRIVLDSRNIDECRAFYLTPALTAASSESSESSQTISPRTSRAAKQSNDDYASVDGAASGRGNLTVAAGKASSRAGNGRNRAGGASPSDALMNGHVHNHAPPSRFTRSASASAATQSSTVTVARKRGRPPLSKTHISASTFPLPEKLGVPHNMKGNSEGRGAPTNHFTHETGPGRVGRRSNSLKNSAPELITGSDSEGDDNDDDNRSNCSEESTSAGGSSPRWSHFPGRYSNRVFALSHVEGSTTALEIEQPHWNASEYMCQICTTQPEVVPKFVYATESYLGSTQDIMTQYGQSTASYQCCTCEGDCARNPTCQCIMRNGQRNPYSAEGRFDFCKGKIFECGPYCSCKVSECSLRLTQRGVSLPLVVCMMGQKGYGVMATKVILKGAFVCTYVGVRVSEDDLILQEDEKMRLLKNSKNGFVTYAFEIHDGVDSFNVDSEHVGNVARFFNHSCDPNLRPIKVVGSSYHRTYPTMSFFALRRIEAGEELTWKYVSGVKARSGQVCKCGAANCVGYV